MAVGGLGKIPIYILIVTSEPPEGFAGGHFPPKIETPKVLKGLVKYYYTPI